MVEKFRVVSVLPMTGIRIDEDEGSSALEHMAYRIVIETTVGEIVISGNHDSGPDVAPSPLLIEETL